PSAPGKLTRRLLWVRMIFLPTCTWIDEKRSACSGNSTIMARASLARSRAVVTWRSSGRPLTLAKCVRVMPSCCAASFMRAMAAGDCLSDHDGDVVGGLHDEDLERDIKRDRTADWKSELR